MRDGAAFPATSTASNRRCIVPATVRDNRRTSQTVAVNNARQILLALFEYETAHGQYPDTLDEAVRAMDQAPQILRVETGPGRLREPFIFLRPGRPTSNVIEPVLVSPVIRPDDKVAVGYSDCSVRSMPLKAWQKLAKEIHATATRGMGFCIFNHVAIAARHLQSRHGLQRVAIIDWDVHHGNGTEAIFIEDPSVLYISLHENGIYPYTGAAQERGQGAGEGANLNIPLPGASDGEVALNEWAAQIFPVIDAFKPDFLLISAGFDARAGDPVGGLHWSDETFAEMTRRCVAMAEKHCGGKIVSVLEGGYNPAGLSSAAVAHVRAL